jgi:hypothetical protein
MIFLGKLNRHSLNNEKNLVNRHCPVKALCDFKKPLPLYALINPWLSHEMDFLLIWIARSRPEEVFRWPWYFFKYIYIISAFNATQDCLVACIWSIILCFQMASKCLVVFSYSAGAHFPLAGMFCRLYANLKGGKMTSKRRSSLSETSAASQSAFIIGQLYSTSVFVNINKLQ